MHTHVGMTSLRGLGEDLPLHEWLNKKIWPQEAKLTSKDVYEGARIGVLESFSSGVTCINEMYLKKFRSDCRRLCQRRNACNNFSRYV